MHKRHRHYRQSKVSKDSSETDGDGDEDEKASGSPCHDLRRLIREKERELHEINEFRSKSLESLAAAKATEVEELKARQAQIRNDFNYNLKLLEERDAELERYDRLFRKMSTNLADRDEEIERLKVIVNDQAASIASFQDQVKAQRDASRRQLMESETALTTLKADHESALATQSESFAAIKKDLMARVASAEASADKRISAVVEEHQQALERMARQHDVEIAEAKRLFSQYQKEQEAKLQDLQSSLATEKANAEGVSILAQSALAEKDAALKLVEAENAQLVKLKHDLLQQYEEKVGSVLNSLHALEVQFAEQRLKHEEELRQAHAERETDVVARTSQLQAQLDASHSDATRLQASLHEANRALQETRAALDEERKVSLARQQALTECETDNRVLVERCNTLRQIIDERNDHVAVLKDLVRHTIEEMKTEQERAREAQRASDLGLHDKVAQAQERTEQVIQSLIAARPTGASVAGQAENLGELQSGLLSIKKDLRTRSMAGSDGGSSSSRRPSLGQLPRAEQVLATIPDMPAIPEMSLRTRRQSSTVLHPMDVKILQSPQNLVVDHQASDNQGPLHTIDDIDCDDGGSQSNGSSSGTQSSAKSYRRSLNSTLRGGGVEDVSAVKAENARLRTQIELLEEEIQRDASILALYKSEASAKTPVDDEQTRQLAERTNQLEKDLETAQRELAAVRQELDKARSDVQKADDEVQAIRYQSADEIARLNAALKDIEDRPVDRTAFDNATAKMTSLTQQVKDLQAQNDELRARASAVADAVPDLDSVLDELRQVRAQQSAGRDQSSRELQDQNQLLTEQNGKLRLAITDMRSEMEAFASVQASMADQVAHLKDANQDHVKRIALLSTPSASGGEREELHLLREQVDKMMRAVDTSYDRVVDAERRNAEQRRQLREQQSNDQKQELEQALSRLEHIVKHNAVLEAEVARLQNAPRAGNERPEKNNVAEREFFQEQIHEHIQEIASLHRELANAQARCASLQDEVRLRVQDLEEANVKIGMIDVLKSRISKLEADLDDARRNPVVQVDAGELLALREENGNLRAKLDEANYELDLLAAEKDRLMEISNMLKANVARLMSDEAVADLPLSVLDMNSDVSKAYATKLSQVERTLRDLLQQNQALRAQIVKGGGAIGSPFLHRHPGMGSEYCSDPLCQLRLVHAYGADLIVKGAAEQQVINRLDKLDEDIRRSIAEEQKPPDISDMRAVAQEAENENAAPGVAGECDVVPERVESRARQRLRKELGSLAHPGSQDKVLDLARRSFRAAARQQQRQPDPHLAMTGSAVELGADPGPGFQRGPTPSQVEAERRQRLARLHRKRQQLLNQRRAIRNYNDP
ncbi:unnamed protein product (mitochondrion) [Plasmodiophora brassicae]|uniref:Uncharacterized protein n=1 Tax=Plasmodiophora brassicae TaxID=37360 RepID=A0A3P3Y821_PLABS|nr:unnamed protein product [Plasmodiophora brassicae]